MAKGINDITLKQDEEYASTFGRMMTGAADSTADLDGRIDQTTGEVKSLGVSWKSSNTKVANELRLYKSIVIIRCVIIFIIVTHLIIVSSLCGSSKVEPPIYLLCLLLILLTSSWFTGS